MIPEGTWGVITASTCKPKLSKSLPKYPLHLIKTTSFPSMNHKSWYVGKHPQLWLSCNSCRNAMPEHSPSTESAWMLHINHGSGRRHAQVYLMDLESHSSCDSYYRSMFLLQLLGKNLWWSTMNILFSTFYYKLDFNQKISLTFLLPKFHLHKYWWF